MKTTIDTALAILVLTCVLMAVPGCTKNANDQQQAPPPTPPPPKDTIVYTDVNPDITLSTDGSLYNLDINKDGVADFKFDFTYKKKNCQCGYWKTSGSLSFAEVIPLNSNSMMVAAAKYGSYKIARLDSAAVIDSLPALRDSLLSWGIKDSMLLSGAGGECELCNVRGTTFDGSGVWVDVWGQSYNKYMALELKVGSNIYYGWARLDVKSNASVIIKDYAYKTIPNHAILSGQTK